jgi:hypothetical protein
MRLASGERTVPYARIDMESNRVKIDFLRLSDA